jgi:uncharacterized protein (TIGR04255 family)
MQVPKKIKNCPIVEVICEIRFEPNVDSDAVFGMILREVRDRYPTVEKLPILQIPEDIRNKAPNLIYQPHYRLSATSDFAIQIGPRVVSILNKNRYPGWELFYSEIQYVIQSLQKLDIITILKRVGLRYVNFFEEMDIFSKLELKISFSSENNPNHIMNQRRQTHLNTQVDLADNFIGNVNIANNGTLQSGVSQEIKTGSLLDIDIFLESNALEFTMLETHINSAHSLEKNVFFNVLKADFIQQLEPEN